MKQLILCVFSFCVFNSVIAQTQTIISENNSISDSIQLVNDEQGVIESWLSLPANTVDNGISAGNISVTGSAITVEALITIQNSNPLPEAYDIVSKHASTIDCNYLFRPNTFAVLTSDGFASVDNPILLCPDSTYHVAGSYDGDSLFYFVNGVKVASEYWSGTLYENSYSTGIGNVTFSADYNEQFTGYIDEVRIWNIARTPTELNDNMYYLPDPLNMEGLLAYYRFNGDYSNAQGNTMYDGSPYGVDVSLDSNPWYFGTVAKGFCNPVSVFETMDQSNLIVYPNPTSSDFRIQSNTLSPRAELTLINLMGEIIFQQNVPNTNNTFNYQLNMENLPNGSYFIKLKSDTESFCRKVMKQE